jgi:hypothetical protein
MLLWLHPYDKIYFQGNFVKLWISQNWKKNPWWPHVNPHALQNVEMHIYV